MAAAVDVAAAAVVAGDAVVAVVVDAVVATDTDIKEPTGSVSSNKGPADAGPFLFQLKMD